MNFHILSDIHLEFCPNYSLKQHVNKYNRKNIEEKEEINLILAGDIGYPSHKNTTEFIEQCSRLYDHVFIVMGNHEYYKSSIEESMYKMKEIIKLYPNCHLLDSEIIKHNNIYIIGSTLWTHIGEDDPARKSPINDYSCIKDFTIDTSNRLHLQAKTFLRDVIENVKKENGKCIVITHHLPSFSLIDLTYKDSPHSPYFASNCDEFIISPVKYWIYGHTHMMGQNRINGVDLLCNPKGYPSEWSKYSKTITFHI